MSDEPFAPEPPRRTLLQSTSLIGGIAFIGGIAVALGAVQLGGGFHRAPAPPAPLASPTATPAAPQAAPTLPPGTDIATLHARETMLAGKLEQLEMRLRDMDGSARNAAGYATQAERLLIAAAVRRAVERG